MTESVQLQIDPLDVNDDCIEIPLPQGKEYHVFFSYRDVEFDRTWVQSLMSYLENKYKLKCCDHVRDFVPGCKIMTNVHNCVPKSMTSILVLSKGYNDSQWCQYEMEYILYNSMKNKDCKLIPVIIEDCEIPNHLKPITNLDCKGEMKTWITKLVNAILKNEDIETDVQKTVNIKDTVIKYNNLDKVYEEITHTSDFSAKYVPEGLDRSGLSIDWKIFKDVRSQLAEAYKKKWNMKWRVILFLLGAISLFLIIYGSILTSKNEIWINYITFYSLHDTDVLRPLGITFLLLGVLLMAASINIYLHIHNLYLKETKEWMLVLADTTKIWRKYNLICAIYDKFSYLQIIYYYYDWQPCILYTKEQINPKAQIETTITKDQENKVTDDEALEIVCVELLEKISSDYIHDFQAGKLEHGNGARHCRRAICLCEYAEIKGYLEEKCKTSNIE